MRAKKANIHDEIRKQKIANALKRGPQPVLPQDADSIREAKRRATARRIKVKQARGK